MRKTVSQGKNVQNYLTRPRLSRAHWIARARSVGWPWVSARTIRRPMLAGFALILLLSSCRSAEQVTSTPATLLTLSQWAVDAAASSTYAVPDWGTRRATGMPEIVTCADDPRAWASARGTGTEWLELTYAQPVMVTEVRVFQSYGRGAISRISLADETGALDVIWEGTDVREPCPGVLTVSVLTTPYYTQVVRIDLDESRTGYWNQIDAVELIGVR